MIRWHLDREGRRPFGGSPDPARLEPIGFPPPWPDRPWIYAVVVASANGVLGWRRRGPGDDPVLAVLGGDARRPERIADARHLRHLRCFGDVAIGAQTLRDQPRLVLLPVEPGDEPMPALCRFRRAHGLLPAPRQLIYSLGGNLDLDLPVFNTPGVDAVVVTTERGAAELRRRGSEAKGVDLVVDALEGADGLVRSHRRLFAERGVRYLACEGGEVVLRALHRAGLLDEVFVTVTDVQLDESRHAGVLRIFDFEAEGAELVAEGRTAEDSRWRFRRWRFNPR